MLLCAGCVAVLVMTAESLPSRASLLAYSNDEAVPSTTTTVTVWDAAYLLTHPRIPVVIILEDISVGPGDRIPP